MQNYEHYSTGCSKDGDGQCDGTDYEHFGKECACSCHAMWEPLHTTEEYALWHRLRWAAQK